MLSVRLAAGRSASIPCSTAWSRSFSSSSAFSARNDAASSTKPPVSAAHHPLRQRPKLDPKREPDNSRLRIFTSKKIQLPQRSAPIALGAPSLRVKRDRRTPGADLKDSSGPSETILSKYEWLRTGDSKAESSTNIPNLLDAIVSEAYSGQEADALYLYNLLRDHMHSKLQERSITLGVPTEEVPFSDLDVPVTLELFTALLNVAAEQGSPGNARILLQDMRRAGIEPTIRELNLALEVAAKGKCDLFTVEVLDQIASLPADNLVKLPEPIPTHEVPRLVFDGQDRDQPSFGGLFHPAYVAHWTPETIHALAKLCMATHNTEFALGLLGLATIRAKQSGNYPASIGDWIGPEARDTFLHLLLFMKEPGLAYDFCRICVSSVGEEALHTSAWLALLHCCADLHFMPGIVLGWKVLTSRHVHIHEGLVTLVLEASGRNGSCKMAERAFKQILQIKQSQFQDWHVLPLLEAYIRAHRWEDTFRTLAMARRAGVVLDETMEDMLAQAIGSTYGSELDSILFNGSRIKPTREDRRKAREERIDAAIRAMYAVGKVTTPQGGVDIIVLNSILKALASSSEPGRVLQVLRHAQRLYGVTRKGDIKRVSPTIHTYNAALLALVELGDQPAAEALMAQTLPEELPLGTRLPTQGPASGPQAWTKVTYERLIHLALRMQDTAWALALHRGARRSGQYLTFSTYLSLILYLFHRSTPGWRDLLLEMKRSGAPMPKAEYLKTLGLAAKDWIDLGRPTANQRPTLVSEAPRDGHRL